jgi:hypothetical protein
VAEKITLERLVRKRDSVGIGNKGGDRVEMQFSSNVCHRRSFVFADMFLRR